jgi:glycyl-tRNA synthetase beta chain
LEIGVEEVPSAALYKATEQLARLAEEALAKARIEHGRIETRSTPRRIILQVERLGLRTQPLVQQFRGPAKKIAYDADGNLTKAALGFAKSKGVAPDKLSVKTENGQEYLYAQVEEYSHKTQEVLPNILLELVKGLHWPKSMHWGATRDSFVRPVRWLVSLWGGLVVPFEFAGVVAGRRTWGHHLIADAPFEVASADDLPSVHTKCWVESSAVFRRQRIEAQIKTLCEKAGLVAHLDDCESTMREVVNLVEYPTTLIGTFDQMYLQIPPEIIVDAITKHQRYFPLYQPDGQLSNRFLVVSNGTPAHESDIIAGHERVVRPRLDDARFFFEEDKQQPLEDYREQLKEVVFHEKLGSTYDKSERMLDLARQLATAAVDDDNLIADCVRAAQLAKCDLVTQAVVEFTDLQGTLGYYYAVASGESDAVACAIREHYQPRFSGDALPPSFTGKIVALADKLDSLAGLFAVGEAPTGSSDPFALRRSALGVINILRALPEISLEQALEAALCEYEEGGLAVSDHAAVIAELSAFFAGRLEVIAKDLGFASDTIQAVLATGGIEPKQTLDRIQVLESARKNRPELFADLATAYARANNLREAALGTEVDPKLFGEAETTLYEAVQSADQTVATALKAGDYPQAVDTLAGLREPIDRLFTDVMIMDKDAAQRDNRLRLLNLFTAVFAPVADISKMAKK